MLTVYKSDLYFNWRNIMIKPMQYILDFEKYGLGLFIHYGVYSQYEQGEWVLNIHNLDPKQYEEKARNTDFSTFDANNFVKAAKLVGAKYVTLTTRHHDGFSLYDTRGLSDYDVMHTPNGRDLIAEFCNACRAEGLVPFFYHTTLDWRHKDFNENFDSYLEYLYKSVEILCTYYGEVGGFWFDGNWSKPDADWKLDEFYGMIRRLQPNAIIDNNTGLMEQGVVSHPEIDSVSFEQGRPTPVDYEKYGKYVSGEMSFTLNEHWGVAKDINYKSMKWIVESAATCRRYGNNLLVNIGPNMDSTVPLMQQALLAELGKWVDMCKDSFYHGRPSNITGEGEDFVLDVPHGCSYAYLFGISTWGDINVLHSQAGGYKVFENVTRRVKGITFVENNEEAVFSQDLSTNTLTLHPSRFVYGNSWIVRVAKIEFEA